MTEFIISNLQDASILALNDLRDVIKIDPEYQREGGVWSLQKKQLFIDSLLNKYDVPKFYFHQLSGKYKDSKYQYSIVDGRQRLEAIWDFLEGKFPLSDDIEYDEDKAINIAGKTYGEIAKEYPRLSTRLNSRTLTVMVIAAEDIDFIEDMFTRLNEAVPLNAAEKRNSFGGPLPRATRELVKHPFFTDRVKVAATRYRHHDLVARILYLQWWLDEHHEITDTKKESVDSFYRYFSKRTDDSISSLVNSVRSTLDVMAECFVSKDILLKSSGMPSVYFLLFSIEHSGGMEKISRKRLVDFEDARAENRSRFAQDEVGVDFRLIEYDELARSSSDAAAIAARLNTLRKYLDL